MTYLMFAAVLVQGVVVVDQAIEGPINGQAFATNPAVVVQVLAPQRTGTLVGVDVRPFAAQPGMGGFVWGLQRLSPFGVLDRESFFAGGAVEGRAIGGQAEWLRLTIDGDNRQVQAGQRYALMLGEIGSGHTLFETTDGAGGYTNWTLENPYVPIVPRGDQSLLFRTHIDVLETPGDTNQDGRVDLQDFGVLKANFGSTGNGISGDVTGDGRVDLADFGVLKANFGAAGVPEPATLALMLAGLLAFGLVFRCRLLRLG
jgi:hypothetical protein